MAAELVVYLTGGAANDKPDLSLGGVTSSEELSAVSLNNLFDDIDPDEALAGDTEYRALSIVNDGDASAVGIEIWFVSQTTSDDTEISLGLDATATQLLANESTAPAAPAVVFTTPTSGAPLALGDLAAAAEHRIFFKRVCDPAAVNHNNDEFELAIRYA